MLIKYFYQFEVGHQFQIDKSNGMVIPDIKQNYLMKKDIIDLLEKDKVEIGKIESIKYFNPDHDGWIEISDFKGIDVKKKHKEILLLLKMREDLSNYGSDLQQKFAKLINSVSALETRIIELEKRLRNKPVLVSSPSGGSQSAEIPGIDLYRNSSNVGQSMYFAEEPRLDISFLYANPLVRDVKDRITPLNEPIDFESEINCLVNIFQNSEKKISARFEVANIDNISEIIRKKPKILHISCHGAYEEVNGENKFFLHFEQSNGKLHKFSVDDLNSLLKPSVDEKYQIEVVFVSACHSEAIANVFREAKVPAVICVHSMTKILDEAAQKFAKFFYHTLLDGKSIGWAFEHAKQIVSSVDKVNNIVHCCCSHIHKPGCRWQENAIKNYEKAHQSHLKRCKCEYKESHMHSIGCMWAQNCVKLESCEYIQLDKHFKICCCSPEIAHDESNKFVLKADPNYENEVLFHNLPNGPLEIKNKNCCLYVNFSVDMKTSLIGRNIELYNVVSIFSSQNLNKNRLITVYGAEGLGKNSFVKLAGKYMFERKCFQDGVIYINTYGEVISEMWLVSKIISNLELDNPVDGISQFCKIMSPSRILIIISFGTQTEESLAEIKNIMKFIMLNTKMPKLLISINKPLELELWENKIELKTLDEYYTAKLLMTLAGAHLPRILREDINELVKHEIVKISQGIPSKIHQIAGLLQEHKKLEVLIEKIKKENIKKQTLADELVQIILENNHKNANLIFEIIFVLSILPHGILSSEIMKLACFKNCFNEIFDILDRTIIVTKSYSKDFGDYVYLMASDLVSSVGTLAIDENVKIKCLRDLIIFYGNLMRSIVGNVYVNNENPMEFSAALNQGLWLSLNSEFQMSYQNSETIYQPIKRYNFNESNIFSILRLDNQTLKSLMAQADPELIESVEQLSICMPTVLKLGKKMTDCINCSSLFLTFCDKFKLHKSTGRLYLFKASLHSNFYMLSNSNGMNANIYDTNSNCTALSTNIFHAKEIFKDFEEGDAEASFVKAVTTYEMEVTKNKSLPEKMPKEIFNDIIKELEKSVKIYRKIQNSFGLARVCFVIGEYCISNKKYEETVLNFYKEALSSSEKSNKVILQVRCLQGISKWYMGIKNPVNSKHYAEQAKSIAEKLKNNNEKLLYDINNQINEILDQSKIQSHNVFVFIKAHQLVRTESGLHFQRSRSVEPGLMSTNHDNEYPVGPLVNHYSVFRERLQEKFNKTRKELIIKFDYLTEITLREILSKVGRVLHISSDDYNDSGSLYVEGQDGESHEFTPFDLKAMLSATHCLYDVVILAIPQSEKLAQVFVDAGIPHVVCFQFLKEFVENCEIIPNVPFYNVIHEFTIEMLSGIINEQTIQEAYNNAVREFNSQIVYIRDHLYTFNLRRDIIPPGSGSNIASVLLLPEGQNHNVKLYGRTSGTTNDETILFEGKILDLSKMRARLYNMRKRNHAIIGRKREIYQCVQIVKTFPLINIYGEPGCGKTCLIKEICYFLYMRNEFRDGIFYFDMNEIKNVEKIRQFFHEADVYAAIEENIKNTSIESSNSKSSSKTNRFTQVAPDRKILIVFDNVDKLIKNCLNPFFLFLKSQNKEREKPFIHYILVSTKQSIDDNIQETYEVPPLSDTESYFFFLYYVDRALDAKEVDVDQSLLSENHGMIEKPLTMCDLLIYSSRVAACKGNPKYLKRLAELAKNKSLRSIEWKELNLPRLKKKKETGYESQNSSQGAMNLAGSINDKKNHTKNIFKESSGNNVPSIDNEEAQDRLIAPKKDIPNKLPFNPLSSSMMIITNKTQQSFKLNYFNQNPTSKFQTSCVPHENPIKISSTSINDLNQVQTSKSTSTLQEMKTSSNQGTISSQDESMKNISESLPYLNVFKNVQNGKSMPKNEIATSEQDRKITSKPQMNNNINTGRISSSVRQSERKNSTETREMSLLNTQNLNMKDSFNISMTSMQNPLANFSSFNSSDRINDESFNLPSSNRVYGTNSLNSSLLNASDVRTSIISVAANANFQSKVPIIQNQTDIAEVEEDEYTYSSQNEFNNYLESERPNLLEKTGQETSNSEESEDFDPYINNQVSSSPLAKQNSIESKKLDESSEYFSCKDEPKNNTSLPNKPLHLNRKIPVMPNFKLNQTTAVKQNTPGNCPIVIQNTLKTSRNMNMNMNNNDPLYQSKLIGNEKEMKNEIRSNSSMNTKVKHSNSLKIQPTSNRFSVKDESQKKEMTTQISFEKGNEEASEEEENDSVIALSRNVYSMSNSNDSGGSNTFGGLDKQNSTPFATHKRKKKKGMKSGKMATKYGKKTMKKYGMWKVKPPEEVEK